jgi:hypothetical protein
MNVWKWISGCLLLVILGFFSFDIWQKKSAGFRLFYAWQSFELPMNPEYVNNHGVSDDFLLVSYSEKSMEKFISFFFTAEELFENWGCEPKVFIDAAFQDLDETLCNSDFIDNFRERFADLTQVEKWSKNGLDYYVADINGHFYLFYWREDLKKLQQIEIKGFTKAFVKEFVENIRNK